MSTVVSNDAATRLSFQRPLRSLELMLTSAEYFTAVACILLAGEVVLNALIIHFVSYTEIDWTTYMQHIKLVTDGERNYDLLTGSTGAMVYPAGFAYVYSALYYLTNEGKDIKRAQYIFAGVYIVTMGMVFAIYKRCRSVPPYVLILMTLSKRLHSIYVLRLFNDTVAMMFFYAFVLAWTGKKRQWTMGSILYSVALSVKMHILLSLPAVLYIVFINLGTIPTLLHIALIILVQICLAAPFAATYPSQYISGAFNFSRSFDWKWTVNWRWLGEEAFKSQELSRGLLALHVLGLLILLNKWASKEGGILQLARRGLTDPLRAAAIGGRKSSNDYIAMLLFSTNLLGIVCARSLHYQFYSWYAHQIVLLLWHTPFDLVQRLLILGTIEFGWNVFPSTLNSSMALCFANAFVFVGAYYGIDVGPESVWIPLEVGLEKKKM